MKTKYFSITFSFLLGAMGSVSGACLGPLSYNISIVPGFNLIANQLNCGGNTLAEIMPVVPDGTTLFIFNNATKSFEEPAIYIAGFGWFPDPTVKLVPGQGAFLQSSIAFTLTLSGMPNVPALPVPLLPGSCCILSRQTNGVGTYENIVGTPPAEGTTVFLWNEGTQSYVPYNYDAGVWDPAVPNAAVGEAVAICTPVTTNVLCGTVPKWSQLPGYRVFTNSPQMHGGDRPSDVDWRTLMAGGSNIIEPNWVMADDFRSDGRPILTVRWWGSYLGEANSPVETTDRFEDGFVLSFFTDVPAEFNPSGFFSRPGGLLGTYVAPLEAVRRRDTRQRGWDGLPIYQYEVNLKDTCLEHAITNIATPAAFLERSNVIYWVAITAEVGHRVIPVRDTNGVIVDWRQEPTNKRATNHFWGWHTSPTNRLDLSAMGHLLMVQTNWIYPATLWRPNQPFHMELDQAFQLLTTNAPVCETNPPTVASISADCVSNLVFITYSEPMDPLSAVDPANYNISGGAVILSVTLNAAGTVATLKTSALACSGTYVLTISNVRDVCLNLISPNPTVLTFLCPPCPPPKLVKWSQPPGFLVFTNNPQMHGGDRWSDFDWTTLMQAGSNLVEPNWVIAEDFRSDGRPILCVRWWGSYAQGFEPSATADRFFEDAYVLSFFTDVRPPGTFSRPRQLLGSYIAPIEAVKITPTPFIGWDSNRIWQYEVLLEDTCLDHAVTNIARPDAFLERSNVVYWLAITAEVGHRLIPVTNSAGVVVDWLQQPTEKRATNHFWGWHTSPRQHEDVSVMGHVFMQGTNWVYPAALWQRNEPFHMDLDQAFELLTSTNIPPCETNPPVIVSIAADCLSNLVFITYSEPMDPATTEDPANYSLSGGAIILSVALDVSGTVATLETSALGCGTSYAVTVSGVRDLCLNLLVPSPTTLTFVCPPCPPPAKIAKWSQPPGFLVFTNNPQMHGGDRWSDFDWQTLMNSGSNIVEPNWVIAEDFRSDGRPILCVRWWGSYAPGFEPNAANNAFFEDAYVLSFFTDLRPTGTFSRPRRLLGSYIAPIEAVKIMPTPYIGWDSNRIWQYEVALEDTCLDHAVKNVSTPEAFLERSNVVYWLAITAEVGHRIFPSTNTAGIVKWEEEPTNKRATNHFWGWHTSPLQREDVSVMGHVLMVETNWVYPTTLWQSNQLFHMEIDQAFELLTSTNVPPCETNPPVIVSITADCLSNSIVVLYSEPMDPATAEEPVNYALSGGATVLAVTLDASGTVATLETSPLACGTAYTLSISSVRDLCSNLLSPDPTTLTFVCPPCPTTKLVKWSQPPGFLVFTNNPQMHGGDRWSDFDWTTLMQAGSNLVEPNWVIAEDFRSDGRPILCVRWWGSYAQGFEPSATADRFFEDAYVLSFFTDVRPPGTFSRPRQLLGSYIAPIEAVKITPTPYIGWDSNRIWQYEVLLEDTCLDHAVTNIARPDAFLERSNVVYWLAITAEVGHRLIPVTNSAGVVVDWLQQPTEKRATNHFWGWHTSPRQHEDVSVMGHVFMQGTNWVYPAALWQRNEPFHMDLDQAFELLTSTNIPPCETNPPVIVSIAADCLSNLVFIAYSEPMDPATTEDPANYSLSGGAIILSVVLDASGTVATLETSALACGATYALTVRSVRDVCLNLLVPNPATFTFTCPPCPPPTKIAKWSQPPGYQVFPNEPQMHGGDRWSDFDWVTLSSMPPNTNHPNWVIADDFRSDGRPILCVRWWGSYAKGLEPTSAGGFFEDGYVLSFFSDFRPPGAPSQPDRLLGTYVAPISAVKVQPTPYIGWDSNRIWQYEVVLKDTCLDHAVTNIATPEAFLERSNVVYWLAVTAEVGHRIIPITNNTGAVVEWRELPTNKRATNHFWGWHTSPLQREDVSVMGHVVMMGLEWIYPSNLWMTNQTFHMEIDQAFELLTACDTNRPIVISVDPDCLTNKIVVTFSEPMEPGPANLAANYFLINLSGGPGATVLSAMLSADGLSVCLQTTALQCDDLYALAISTNLTDLCGNPLPPTIDGYWFSCPCPMPKLAKWSQPPGFLVFTNNPQMHGGDRWSDFDWRLLMDSGTNIVQPNWVIADDFRSDGRPILCVRWWGSYAEGFEPRLNPPGFFEDGYVLSFFDDFRPTNSFSRPRRLLGSYVAPIGAVNIRPTPYVGWDSNRIWQYEVALADTCLDHPAQGIARPSAFLEKSNRVYWLAITAEVGHRIAPVRDTNGVIVKWEEQPSDKRATNHFWGWHTSPRQREDVSVMGHLLMPDTNWVYPRNLWATNQTFHMELDQAFELLTGPVICPTPTNLSIRYNLSAATVTISWGGTGFVLQAAPEILTPTDDIEWTDISPTSPVTLSTAAGRSRFYRLICP